MSRFYLPRLQSIRGLLAALNGKEAVGTAQTILDNHLSAGNPHVQYAFEEDVSSALNAKANVNHTHIVGDVAELQSVLDEKENSGVAAASLAAHSAQSDPHPQYANAASVDTLLASKADLIDGLLATSQLPAIAISEFLGSIADSASMLALPGQRGDYCYRTDLQAAFWLTTDDPTAVENWLQVALPTVSVQSVNGQTGIVVLAPGDIGAASESHHHEIEDVTGLQTALASKAPQSRMLTAGTGLSGGGDLSADRTLAVSYGTSAGTTCQGNDSRLSDARTPTTHASSHGSAGPDSLTLAQSQITNLIADLTAKANLSGATFTGSISAPNMTFSGLLIGGDSTSANAQKNTRQVCMHYSASNVYFTTLLASGQASANVVAYGGGTAAAYAATHLRFIAAANTTTLTGTVVAEFTYNGATFNIPVIVSGDTLRIATPKTPASASATGIRGDFCWDSDYLYVCTSTNSWKRISLSSW